MRRRSLVVATASWFAVACHAARAAEPESPPGARAPLAPAAVASPPAAPTAPSAASVVPAPLAPTALPPGATSAGCPSEMARVERPQGAYCIDRWEASLLRRTASGAFERWPSNQSVDGRESEMVAVSARGARPQGYVSGRQAARACENAGKRLCAMEEWVRACRGASGRKYPYGDERRADVCNDRFEVLDDHPVVTLFRRVEPRGADRARMWQPEFMNDPRLHDLPRSVEPTGARAECKSEYDVYDLVGNLHEWIDDPDGTFVGGFFMDTYQNGEGCGYRTRAHDAGYHDYSTGFRCCKDG